METWKPIKHRTMSRVGCRRITPSDYPLKRKRKLEIATVGTVDIFLSDCKIVNYCKNRFIGIQEYFHNLYDLLQHTRE